MSELQAVLASEAEESVQHLSFRVRDARYALPIDLVREIIEYGQVTTVPMMPVFIHGVINLRGNVVPVMDLAARFGQDLSVPNKRTCIVIIELDLDEQHQRIGLVVDAVDAVLDIEPDQVEQAPPSAPASAPTSSPGWRGTSAASPSFSTCGACCRWRISAS